MTIFEEALAQYQLAAKADPSQAHAQVNLISLYGRMNQPELAEQAYRDAVAINADLEEAHYNYGVLQSGLGRHAEAARAYRDAVATNPYSTEARVNLGDALEKLGDADGAARQYGRVLEGHPSHRLANFRLGTLLFRRGERQQAVEHLGRTVGVEDAQSAQFLVVLARAERAVGREEDAAEHAAEARRLARRHNQTRTLAVLDREFPDQK